MYFDDKRNNYGIQLAKPTKMNRNVNFIGQDYHNSSLYLAEAVYDDLKIYKGALTLSDVKTRFQNDGK